MMLVLLVGSFKIILYMEELIINKYQAKTIENALRLAMNQLKSRSGTTAMDRELLLADKHIKEVLSKSK